MRVLVTGASGFIGSHTIIQLLQRGYNVRGTLRDLDRAQTIEGVIARQADTSGLEFCSAELEADRGWQEAVTDCDYILHIASPIPRVLPKDADRLIVPASDGALRVIRAGEAAGVRRVVMTASTASICYGHDDTARTFTEADWSDPEGSDNSAYTRSKTLAERRAWDHVKNSRSRLELSTIHPGAVLGPVLEADYGTSAEIVLKLLAGDFPGKPRIGFPLVDVRDVADLHIRAMESEQAAGERFLCANEFMWLGEIAELLRTHFPAYDRKLPRRNLPDFAMKLATLFDPVARGVTFELGIRRDCDSSKARSLLGWEPRSNEEAILATAQSLITQGLVK